MMSAPPRQRFRLAVLAVAALALLGAACGGDDGDDGDDAGAAPGTVRVVDNAFRPDDVQVSVGDTVTWEFTGATLHNVIGDGFKSENQKDGTFEHTFNSAGTYDYVCTLHPGMKGTVEVG
jgi:plastocyanin